MTRPPSISRFSTPRSTLRPAAVRPAALPTVRLGLLCGLCTSLIVLGGCSGSRLGETVGKTLEPDPQLVEPADSVAVKPADQNEPVNKDSQAEVEQNTDSDTPEVAAGEYTDLGQAPEEIQPYLVDLIELDLLKVRQSTPAASANAADKAKTPASPAPSPTPSPAPPRADEFRPNQAITRREYARWLLAANNRFYADQRTRTIRPGVTSSTPVFQDVKANDPDFGAIQGLAEAGIIPSPLTGSSTALTFRPDAPLTRKDLLLWKVPLDTRSPLPQATAAAVEQAWGFQDASKIEPRALQAVLADYQNGDFANIRRAFNYTTLFQPDKAATRAEAAAVLWRFGNSTEGITAADVRSPQANQAEASRPTVEPVNPPTSPSASPSASPSRPPAGAARNSPASGAPQGG
jgi:hypothetical protein